MTAMSPPPRTGTKVRIPVVVQDYVSLVRPVVSWPTSRLTRHQPRGATGSSDIEPTESATAGVPEPMDITVTDHVLASPDLEPVEAIYHHDWRTSGLSDHSALEVTLRPRASAARR